MINKLKVHARRIGEVVRADRSHAKAVELRPPVRQGGRPVLGLKKPVPAIEATIAVAKPLSKKKQRLQVLTLFQEQHPKTFAPDSVQPLKIGINADLSECHPDLSSKSIRGALAVWTSSKAYLRACTIGASRVDLDGLPCGAVNDAQAAYATKALREVSR